MTLLAYCNWLCFIKQCIFWDGKCLKYGFNYVLNRVNAVDTFVHVH